MSATRFKKGDKPKVRSWNDMAKQYGVDENGDMNTPGYSFVKKMMDLCGNRVMIRFVDGDCYACMESSFSFTDDMFESDDDGQPKGSPTLNINQVLEYKHEMEDIFRNFLRHEQITTLWEIYIKDNPLPPDTRNHTFE